MSDPDPYAIYGYAIMQLALKTIADAGANGANKADIVKALFATTATPSVLGTFGFDKNGDTTLKSYGVYKVSGGVPTFFESVTPTKVVS